MSVWPARLSQWRSEIENAALITGLAPELIAAIMDRESFGGLYLVPPGPTGTGDNGHGHGLLQIDDRTWPDFCADVATWGNPEANILFGAKLLESYISELGSVPAGVAAYNAGPGRVQKVVTSMGPDVQALDQLTTGRNYCSWVLNRCAELQG